MLKLALFVLILYSANAVGCRCAGLPIEEVEEVIHARVLSTSFLEGEGGRPGKIRVTYELLERLGGEDSSGNYVFESAGTCSYGLRAGESYILVVSRDRAVSKCWGVELNYGRSVRERDQLNKYRNMYRIIHE